MLKFKDFQEMDKYLHEIDSQMRKDGVPIEARQLQALSRISSQHGDIEFNISNAMELSEYQTENLEGDVLTRRIIDWFDELYGDRLKISFRDGKSIAIVRGDPYRIYIPMVLGDVDLIFDAANMGISGKTGNTGKTIVNVLDHYKGISKSVASSVSRSEKFRLTNEFRVNTRRFRRILSIARYEDTFDVKADIDTAVEQIMAGEFSQSRWSSLQAAEKSLKSILACQGLDYPRVHDLFELAIATGIFTLDPVCLDLANCSPSVRYEPSISSQMDAVRAHYASLAICCEAALEIHEINPPERDLTPSWVTRMRDGGP